MCAGVGAASLLVLLLVVLVSLLDCMQPLNHTDSALRTCTYMRSTQSEQHNLVVLKLALRTAVKHHVEHLFVQCYLRKNWFAR
jgi:hypothetical protein